MNLSTECLEISQVESLLQGNLTPEEYEAAQEHLEHCETCRARVEATIGPAEWWSDIQSVLLNFRTRSLSQRNASATEVETSDRSTAKLLDLLGPTDDPNMLGRIGPYEIIALLGQGGMGAVFKGFDRSLNRFVAIKMLLPHLAASGAARKRFAREAQAIAAVVDDHVMAIHCVDEWQGVPYLVMTYSRGITLQKRLSDNGPLAVREILRIGLQAAKGLAAAHAQGIVHRDIKPANIFLDQTVERVQLMDFGLARAVDDASLTRTGVLAGTPQYMSPEQARAESVDQRSDLFSLGSVMYAMCTGHAPFRAESSYSVLRLITDKEPRSIQEINPDIPDWLCAIVARLMAKQACDRFEMASDVSFLLEECLAHVQQPSTKPLPKALMPLPTATFWRLSAMSRKRLYLVCFFLLTCVALGWYRYTHPPMGVAQLALSDLYIEFNQFPHPWSLEVKTRFTEKCIAIAKRHPNTFGGTEAIFRASQSGDPTMVADLLEERIRNAPIEELKTFLDEAVPLRPHIKTLLERTSHLAADDEFSLRIMTLICLVTARESEESEPPGFRRAAYALLQVPDSAAGFARALLKDDWRCHPWAISYRPELERLEQKTSSSLVRQHCQYTLGIMDLGQGNHTDAAKRLEEIARRTIPTIHAKTQTSKSSFAANENRLSWYANEILKQLRSATGVQAPHTSGVDLEGNPFALSDYHGKVVMFVGWASWCAPCMAMIPHEVEIHTKYSGRPFVIIGFNGDKSSQTAKQIAESKGIVWRSFASGFRDGDDSLMEHPIATLWGGGWPSVFLIDENGIIKYRWSGAPPQHELDEAIESMVKALEQKQE